MDLTEYLVNNRVTVKVTPNTRKNAILKTENNIIHVAVAAPPDQGKANRELERFLSKHTGKNATVKSGFTKRTKVVLIR